MFTKKIPIIYLTKDKLKLVLVKLGKEPKVLKSDEISWNKDSLGESFKQAKKQLKTKTIRLLLADNLSYILQLNIPFDVKSANEKDLVKSKIKPEMPEILESEDWGFKESGRKTQSDKQIIAFAPVKSSFSLISQALVDAGLKAEAVEPEVISKIRHENPLIGIALKTDLKGKDERTLNIIPKKLLPSKPKPEKTQVVTPKDGSKLQVKADPKQSQGTNSELKKKSPPDKPQKSKINKTFIIIFLTTLVLGSLITGGILVQRNALESRPSPTPSSLAIASPEPTPSPTPSPSPEPKIILSDFKIQALNGTGGKGVAGAVKDLLEAEGFEGVKADNAPKLDHIESIVQLKADTPNAVWEIINQILNTDYDLVKNIEPLTDDNDYDVIITVGQTKEN